MDTRKIKVLIVEDSPDDAYLVERVLRRHGFQPECLRVQTDDDMRTALSEGEWDVIISDYLMPEFNALGAMQICRDSGKDIPFIVVSGSIGEDVAVEAMKSGVHDYMMKDNLGRLPVAVERELRQASIRGERRAFSEAMSTSLADLLQEIGRNAQRSLELAEGNPTLDAALRQMDHKVQQALGLIDRLRDKRNVKGAE